MKNLDDTLWLRPPVTRRWRHFLFLPHRRTGRKRFPASSNRFSQQRNNTICPLAHPPLGRHTTGGIAHDSTHFNCTGLNRPSLERVLNSLPTLRNTITTAVLALFHCAKRRFFFKTLQSIQGSVLPSGNMG